MGVFYSRLWSSEGVGQGDSFDKLHLAERWACVCLAWILNLQLLTVAFSSKHTHWYLVLF